MKNVVIARIDDRLIHGQVVTAWVKWVKTDGILIVDNELAANDMMKRIYRAAAPSGIRLYVRKEEEAVDFILNKEEDFNYDEELMVLAKTPQIFEDLINKGIKIDKVILGGMGSNKDRKQLIKNCFASPEEKASMERMLEKGTEVVFQLVPDDRPHNVRRCIE